MAQKSQRRRPSARKHEPPKDDTLIGSPSNGSHFDILSEETLAQEKHLHSQYNNGGSIVNILGGARDQSFWGSHPGMSYVPIHPLAPDDSTKEHTSPERVEPMPDENSQISQMEEDPSTKSAPPS
ncbi:ABC transporter substrate-binding protein [Sesbania bispinosa]|nr:ABC transporter substrate-binding protein [Sesbania bispinosa]